MKLADWFDQRGPDGKKRRQYEFARRIGVSAGMIPEYCNERIFPTLETHERIVIETNGDVTPNDFLRGEAAELLRERSGDSVSEEAAGCAG